LEKSINSLHVITDAAMEDETKITVCAPTHEELQAAFGNDFGFTEWQRNVGLLSADSKARLAEEMEKQLKGTSKLVAEANKRVLGQVVEVRDVLPRKRVKLTTPPPLEAPDYKRAFDKMKTIVRKHHLDGFFICGVCCDVDYAAYKRDWVDCRHCNCRICPACLPAHEPDSETLVNAFYCHSCREHRDELADIEPGYQAMKVQVGGIMAARNDRAAHPVMKVQVGGTL
jgi:hypothetical protein